MENQGVNAIEILPSDPKWRHATAEGADGVQLHYVREGSGPNVLLLHGWPGFWYDWRRVIPTLSEFADVLAPDFRGFGDSEKPLLPPAQGYTPEVFARDMVSILDALEIDQVTVAAHDIGATIAQFMARIVPERIKALVLLNPPYPGIGSRRFDPSAQREFWYQQFHNLPIAEQLIGYNRDTVRYYLSYFYDHWAGRKQSILENELEAIIDAYSKPGAVSGSIYYYRARSSARAKEASERSGSYRISVPTTVLWGEADPVIPSNWSDRLGDYFSQFSLRLLPGVGHFVPIEAPEETISAIRTAVSET